MNRIRLYLELTKPRILVMVLVTTTLGFLLGGTSRDSVALLFFTLFGVGSATGGAAVLNNYLERDFDAKMVRTRNRALPAGLIEPVRALTFGLETNLLVEHHVRRDSGSDSPDGRLGSGDRPRRPRRMGIVCDSVRLAAPALLRHRVDISR